MLENTAFQLCQFHGMAVAIALQSHQTFHVPAQICFNLLANKSVHHVLKPPPAGSRRLNRQNVSTSHPQPWEFWFTRGSWLLGNILKNNGATLIDTEKEKKPVQKSYKTSRYYKI